MSRSNIQTKKVLRCGWVWTGRWEGRGGGGIDKLNLELTRIIMTCTENSSGLLVKQTPEFKQNTKPVLTKLSTIVYKPGVVWQKICFQKLLFSKSVGFSDHMKTVKLCSGERAGNMRRTALTAPRLVPMVQSSSVLGPGERKWVHETRWLY